MTTPHGIHVKTAVEIDWQALGATFANADSHAQARFLMGASFAFKAMPQPHYDMQMQYIADAANESKYPAQLRDLKRMLDGISERLEGSTK